MLSEVSSATFKCSDLTFEKDQNCWFLENVPAQRETIIKQTTFLFRRNMSSCVFSRGVFF